MKNTILGIEVGTYGVYVIKRYIHEHKLNLKENTKDSAWFEGYTLANAELSIREIKKDGTINRREEIIIRRFLEHIQFPKTSKDRKLYSKGWF